MELQKDEEMLKKLVEIEQPYETLKDWIVDLIDAIDEIYNLSNDANRRLREYQNNKTR